MNKIYKMFTNFLDWWNKFSSRLKGIGYLVAVIFFILFIANNGYQRQQIEELVKKMTGLDVQNDILEKTNKRLDAKLDEKDSLIIARERIIDSLSEASIKSERKANYWKKKHGDISEELAKIPDDSSYKFLQLKFNYPGKYIFPFNGPQVKGLHRIYLENENKSNQLNEFENALSLCKKENLSLNELKNTLEDKFELKSKQFENQAEIISNNEKKVELLRKQLQKESKWFAGFGIGPNIGVTYINGTVTPTIGIGLQYNIYKW